MAGQTRMIAWALPCLAVFVAVALNWFIGALPRKAVFILSAVAVLTGQWVLTRIPQHTERNREAVASMRADFHHDDCLFVQGGMFEQFKYYSARLQWVPPCQFTGNYATPCCPTKWPADRRDPTRFHGELAGIRAKVRGKRLWTYTPEGAPGHWSNIVRAILAEIPARMAEDGCALEWERKFDEAKVQRYRCS